MVFVYCYDKSLELLPLLLLENDGPTLTDFSLHCSSSTTNNNDNNIRATDRWLSNRSGTAATSDAERARVEPEKVPYTVAKRCSHDQRRCQIRN